MQWIFQNFLVLQSWRCDGDPFILRPRGLVLMEKHTIGLHDEKILLLKRNSGETNNIFFEGKINLKLNPHTY